MTKIQRAPRLESGPRTPSGKSWDPVVLDGLRKIARREKKSVSWVLEEVVMGYFGIEHSEYKAPAVTTPASARRRRRVR